MTRQLLQVTSAATLLIALSCTPAQAGTVLTTDFDSLSAGAVTAGDLDSITSGGSWALNTTRGATYNISDDGVTKALSLDDINNGNDGLIDFFTVTLDSAINIAPGSGQSATVSFDIAALRTGADRHYRIELLDDTDSVIANLLWTREGIVRLNDNTLAEDDVNGAGNIGQIVAWDSTSPHVYSAALTVDEDSFDVDFGSTSIGSVSLTDAIVGTNLAAIRVSSDGSNVSNKGIHIDNFAVSCIPEPSSLTLLGLGGCVLVRRRK